MGTDWVPDVLTAAPPNEAENWNEFAVRPVAIT
jgi:hypothetical protein